MLLGEGLQRSRDQRQDFLATRPAPVLQQVDTSIPMEHRSLFWTWVRVFNDKMNNISHNKVRRYPPRARLAAGLGLHGGA